MRLLAGVMLSLLAWPVVAQDLTGYVLTFQENFGSVSVSTSALLNDGKTWYTETKQCGCYTPSDSTPAVQYSGASGQTSPFSILPGGGLDIILGKQTLGGVPTWVGPTISSVAPNGAGFSWQYGYFETSVRFPTNQPGIWPAVWMLATKCLPLYPGYPAECPNDTSGQAAGIPELDLFEVFGAYPGFWTWTFHNFSRGVNDANMNTGTAINLLDGNFHVVGLLWSAVTTVLYVDGTIMGAIPTPPSYKQPLFILLTLGLGSGFPTTSTPNPSHMNVKYVRVYRPPT
jgi:hypothetical protein